MAAAGLVGYRCCMRFGSRSHSHVDSDQVDAKVTGERVRLVRILRNLADRIETAPPKRVSEGLVSMGAAAEALVQAVERAIGRAK